MTDEKRKRVLKQIRTLLAIGKDRSASKAECENAIAHALDLMDRYDIDESEAAAGGDSFDDYNATCVWEGGRLNRRVQIVARVVEQFFHVTPLIEKNEGRTVTKILLFGDEHHRQIAEYVFVYLDRTFAALWQAWTESNWRKAGRPPLDLQIAYMEGLESGISVKLRKDRQGPTGATPPATVDALVRTTTALQRALTHHFGELEKWKMSQTQPEYSWDELQAYTDGHARGQDITVRRPIGSDTDAAEIRTLTRDTTPVTE